MLATGFGPFPGTPVNVTGWLMRRFSATRPRLLPEAGATLKTIILPTAWRSASLLAARAAAAFRPDVIVHFGASGSCKGFAIETQAVNACSGFPDCNGEFARHSCIEHGGPPLRRARLGAAPIAKALRDAGFGAAVSRDAGQYLCNFVLYDSLRRGAMATFIHVPKSGEPACLKDDAPRPREDLLRGARIALRCAARQARLARRRPLNRRLA